MCQGLALCHGEKQRNLLRAWVQQGCLVKLWEDFVVSDLLIARFHCIISQLVFVLIL